MIGRRRYLRTRRRWIGELDEVQIHDDIRKCVAFLLADVIDPAEEVRKRMPMGSAFIVDYPLEGTADGFIYAVTARHVIEGTRPYGNLTIRFNLSDGSGFRDYNAPHDTWTLHPTTDVAVAPLKVGNDAGLDVRWVPRALIATDDFIARAEVAEGDEVFFAGLFAKHIGRTRSLPVFRFGNISLMPHEPIPVKVDPAPGALPVLVDAYLVEARSWGGQSGSPAFLYFDLWRPAFWPSDDDKEPKNREDEMLPRLLGLVSGHYDIDQAVRVAGEIDPLQRVPLNSGMAIVIPASKIIEALEMEELVEERERIAKEHKEQHGSAATPDVAHPYTEGEYERFEDLTRKLVNTPKPDADEKKQ